jgi:hypothetical protein
VRHVSRPLLGRVVAGRRQAAQQLGHRDDRQLRVVGPGLVAAAAQAQQRASGRRCSAAALARSRAAAVQCAGRPSSSQLANPAAGEPPAIEAHV